MVQVLDDNGGLFKALNEPFLLTAEVSEIIKFKTSKPYDDSSFLTHLYVKKRYSLRRIARELGCSKTTVRKKLEEVGIEVLGLKAEPNEALKRKVKRLRKRGLSYQKIAKLFNLWAVKTNSGMSRWHGKTISDIIQK